MDEKCSDGQFSVFTSRRSQPASKSFRRIFDETGIRIELGMWMGFQVLH